MTTPRNRSHEHFDTHVLPAFNHWLANPTDIRLAMSAAVALNQMADHFWHGFAGSDPARVYNATSPGTFRSALATQNPEWSLVRDVAEAHKHVKLARPSRHLTSAGQTVVTPTVYGTSAYDTGPSGGTPSVVVTLDDGSTVHFSSVAKRALEMWQSLLT